MGKRYLSFVLLLVLIGKMALLQYSRNVQAGRLLQGSSPITRPHDPVIITGNNLSTFLNQPINELRIYVYDGTDWAPIPFQVDEVDSTGDFVALGDDDDDGGQGLLDANDQLIFMGNDAGQSASCDDYVALVGEGENRETITIIDNLNGDIGFAYLFQSNAIPITSTTYIDWNEATQIFTGSYNSTYVATFDTSTYPGFLGLSDLTVNGSEDILDRQKICGQYYGYVRPLSFQL